MANSISENNSGQLWDEIRKSTFSNCIDDVIGDVGKLPLVVYWGKSTTILDKQSNSLSTDVIQFGFKKNASTVICTSLLIETIKYYNENNTDCYLILLDASKAFDHVEYLKLLNALCDRHMRPIVLRSLINMYINQNIQVKWNSMISKQCNISNGVKQGGCLSPTYF